MMNGLTFWQDGGEGEREDCVLSVSKWTRKKRVDSRGRFSNLLVQCSVLFNLLESFTIYSNVYSA